MPVGLNNTVACPTDWLLPEDPPCAPCWRRRLFLLLARSYWL